MEGQACTHPGATIPSAPAEISISHGPLAKQVDVGKESQFSGVSTLYKLGQYE